MLNLEFQLPTRIILGKDTQKQIGEIVKSMSDSALLVYGGGSIKKNGLYDEVTKSLTEAGVKFGELSGVEPNPKIALVRKGAELCKKNGYGLVLAVGGGSCIDTAKGIAMGTFYDGDVWDLYEKGLKIEKALPVVDILTIPASGSESSRGSLVVNPEKHIKLGYINSLLRPKVSIINPEYFKTLPKEQIAAGVCDMMCHILERYFTPTEHTDLIDGLAESTLRTIMRNGLIAYKNPDNYDAWIQLGLAGTFAHNNLLGIGRVQDWGPHDIEQEINGLCNTRHGAGLAVLTPYWMEYVYKNHIGMFTNFAVNVMGVEGDFRDPEQMITAAIDRLRDFFKKLGLPATLSELGVCKEEILEKAAAQATGKGTDKEHTLGGIQKLNYDDILTILKNAK